jgi:hypothetical protein
MFKFIDTNKKPYDYKKFIMDRVQIDKDSGCWLWTGTLQVKTKNNLGYGKIFKNKFHKETMAHRASYGAFVGPIPDGRFILHRCDNPKCVNPEHLWLGTHEDNMKDMCQKGRQRNGSCKGMHNPNVGERSSSHKLTEEQVREIKGLYVKNDGCSRHPGENSLTALANKYSVHPTVIWRVVNNKTWKHVK